jgi:hypothetical protein
VNFIIIALAALLALSAGMSQGHSASKGPGTWPVTTAATPGPTAPVPLDVNQSGGPS